MLSAKGAVSKVKELVNEKDAFSKMAQERDTERAIRLAESEKRADAQRKRLQEREAMKSEFYALYALNNNPQKRGLLFEKTLNKIFTLDGMLIRESFTIQGDPGEGIVEQIDGVVELNNHIYLVEAKWWSENIGVGELAQHMLRVSRRAGVRGFYIVNPGFAPAAIASARKELQHNVFVLATTQEIFTVFERNGSFSEWMKKKVDYAVTHQDPHQLFV